VHYLDSCSEPIGTQVSRLAPARAVTSAGIPCVVWSEDALSFAFFVPTGLFNFEILVPDHAVEEAARAIESSLPYKRTAPHHTWREYKVIDLVEANFFPNSICMEWSSSSPNDVFVPYEDPKFVCIHPASHFSFDIHDLNRSMSLVPPFPKENSKIRFPTRVAFFDALIDTFLDSPPTETGQWHSKCMRKLSTHLSYLYLYTLRNRPFAEDGKEETRAKLEMEEESATLYAALKEENRHYFERRALGRRIDWEEEVRIHRSVRAQQGRPSVRPVPRIIRNFLGKDTKTNAVPSSATQQIRQCSSQSSYTNVTSSRNPSPSPMVTENVLVRARTHSYKRIAAFQLFRRLLR